MLLYISSFGLLALLFLAQSRPAMSDYVCNELSHNMYAKLGVCARRVNPKYENHKTIPQINPGDNYLAMLAIAKPPSKRFEGYGIFTCEGVKIFNQPAETLLCCGVAPRYVQTGDGIGSGWAGGALLLQCVERGGKHIVDK